MNSAKYIRHAKIILKHPIKVSFVPAIIAATVSVYIFSLDILLIGYAAGLKKPTISNSTNIYPPVENTFPVFNTESMDLTEIEEFLQREESDKKIINEMNELLYDLDQNTNVLTYKPTDTTTFEDSSSTVLGMATTDYYKDTPKSYPVERKMYDAISLLNNSSLQTANINNVETVDFLGFTASVRNVILPILCLSLAVLGVNYLEDKTLLTKRHHRKHKVANKRS